MSKAGAHFNNSRQSLEHQLPRNVKQKQIQQGLLEEHLSKAQHKNRHTRYRNTTQPWLQQATTKISCQRAPRVSRWERRRPWRNTASLVCQFLFSLGFETSTYCSELHGLSQIVTCASRMRKGEYRGVIFTRDDPSSSRIHKDGECCGYKCIETWRRRWFLCAIYWLSICVSDGALAVDMDSLFKSCRSSSFQRACSYHRLCSEV